MSTSATEHSGGSTSANTAAPGLPPSVVELVAGITAGSAAVLAVHPIDIVKTRLQLNKPTSTTKKLGASLHLLAHIARTEEGGWRALYRGLTPNLLGNGVAWGLYFLFYGRAKEALMARRRRMADATTLSAISSPVTSTSTSTSASKTHLTPSDFFAASAAAGAATAVLSNPLWVLKTRMLASGRDTPGAYRGLRDGVMAIWREEGWRGYWRGLVPGLFGVSQGAVQFVAYEWLKEWAAGGRADQKGLEGQEGQRRQRRQLGSADWLALSAVSKVVSGVATYPYQVVRARMQNYGAAREARGTLGMIRLVWRQEGLRGFYRGLVPGMVRVLPATCVTFVVYENVRRWAPRAWEAATATSSGRGRTVKEA